MGFGKIRVDQAVGTSRWRFQTAVDAARAIRDRQERLTLAARRSAATALSGATSGVAPCES
jgi:hypothetical protein